MEIFYIIGGLIFLFIVWCAVGAFSKIRRSNKVAGSLCPEAAEQFLFWDTESNKASTLGRERDAKVNRAKAVVVAATNCPICHTASGSFPLLCQPGYIETLSESDLDDLIKGFEQNDSSNKNG